MAQEIEIEYKNLLTKQEFDQLLTCYPFPKKSQKQTNFYFDTKGFSLSKNNCALRIREKAGNFQLTLKEPHPNGILETHDLLTKQEALTWLQGSIIKKEHTTRQLNKINILPENLIYYGSLTTERYEVDFNDVLLVLDCSMYNGQLDYELEIEAQSEEIGLQTFNALLIENNIQKRNTPNKIQRFFTTLLK